jgi:hypothetical protein
MAEVDASIPLQVQGPQPITLNSIAQMYQMQQQIQMQKQQRQVQNALSQIYSNPANLGPDGMPNAQAMMQIAKISPQEAQSMTAQRANVDEKLALTSQHQQDAALAFQKNVQAQVREPALNAYDEALKQGKTPQQAQMIGQKAYSDGLDNLIQSGYVPDSMKAQLSQNFDPNGVRASSISYKDQQELNEKKSADDRADQRIALATNVDQQRLGLEAQRVGIEGQRLALAKENAAGTPDGVLDDETRQVMAQQYLAGDKSVMTNLGRGRQGAENIVALRKEIINQAKEQGMTGAEIAAHIAEFGGIQAGERTLGNVQARVGMAVNEAQKFALIAKNASSDFPRGDFVPVNKAIQAYNENTSDPKLAKFAMANLSLANAYATAVGRGTPTDSARQEALKHLSTATSQEAYAATVDQILKETDAANASPSVVRDELHQAITKGSTSSAPPKTVHWDDL